MKTWQDLGFQWELTGDGSPTLRTGEAMHHSGGALSETLQIYGAPLERVFRLFPKPRVLSLGLGLGYVEFVTAAMALKRGRSYEILTLESEEPLVRHFEAFLQRELPAGEIHEGFQLVVNRVAERLQVSASEMCVSLQKARQDGRWRWGGLLSPKHLPEGRFEALLYDAFSSKTCPDLWTDSFLEQFLSQCAADDCVFTTYACTGTLKRSLRKNGFELVRREGFQGKKHSTLGLKGAFMREPDGGREALSGD